MRGNLAVRAVSIRRNRAGSIPARAGEPPRRTGSPPSASGGVYPRACGGTTFSAIELAWTSGLSPRVRGNQLVAVRRGVVLGSIPARAGEPSWSLSGAASTWCLGLSPRVRGNHVLRLSNFAWVPASGLSPRVRGNQLVAVKAFSRAFGGLSPRVRGNPRGLSVRVEGPNIEVYPRACGGTTVCC